MNEDKATKNPKYVVEDIIAMLKQLNSIIDRHEYHTRQDNEEGAYNDN